MKKKCIVLLLVFAVILWMVIFIFGMGNRSPIDFPNTLEIFEKQSSVMFSIETKHEFENYILMKIEFPKTFFERQKIITLHIRTFKGKSNFCFKINKTDISSEDYRSAWIYLYNKKTKRLECYYGCKN